MTALTLTPTQRRALRAQAHALQPVVMIGSDGLTDAVVREADGALSAHGLIKVRASLDDRAARERAGLELCERLDAAYVQHIGKLWVVWRPLPQAQTSTAAPVRAPKQVRVVQFNPRGGTRPQVKVVDVLGNQRLTAGGQVKRAKPRMISAKKQAGSSGA